METGFYLDGHLMGMYPMTIEDEDIIVIPIYYDRNGREVLGVEVYLKKFKMDMVHTFKIDSDEGCKCCGQLPLKVDDFTVDPCMNGLLPGVRNACCGHGDPEEAYIQFSHRDPKNVTGYECVYGPRAAAIIEQMKRFPWLY